MMTDPVKLTVNFVEKEPGSAAVGLERLAPADAAALIGVLPPSSAARAIALMTPWSAARCVELLDPKLSATVFREMPPQDVVSILRQLSPEKHETFLSRLPNRMARDFKRALSYPINTVGAWTNFRFPSILHSARVADALRIVGEMEQSAGSHIFLVNADKSFIGAVGLGELYRLDPSVQISSLKIGDVRPLSVRDEIMSILDDPSWDRFIDLPVIGRKKNFLGALSREYLRRGLAEIESDPADYNAPVSRSTELLVALQVVGTGLIKMCLATGSPATPKPRGNKDGR